MRKGYGTNPPFFAESDAFGAGPTVRNNFGPPVGCPSATSFCATLPGGPAVTGVNIADGFQIFNTPPDVATFTGTLFFQPRNFKLAKVQQFNVNLERQIPGNVVLTVGYAGSRGNHILVAGNNLNTFGPANCSVGTIGCNTDGTPFSPGFDVRKLSLRIRGLRKNHLRFAASQSRDQSIQVRSLCLDRLHVFPHAMTMACPMVWDRC